MRYIAVALIVLLAGCCDTPEPTKVYIDRYTEVKIPVRCSVPKTECIVDNNATYTEVISTMLKCIYDLREAQKVCE